MNETQTKCHTWGQLRTDYSKGNYFEASHFDFQYIGSWVGPDQLSIDVASGGFEIHHTAQNSTPQPGEFQASPPYQTQSDGHILVLEYVKQSVPDEPWNLLHVQHKKT